jgi:hypothetical protein
MLPPCKVTLEIGYCGALKQTLMLRPSFADNKLPIEQAMPS